MKCRNCSNELSNTAKVCSYCGTKVEDEVVQEDIIPEPKKMNGDKVWYYAIQGESFGPFTRYDMMHFLIDGTLNENSYVWTKGMDDWKCWKDSDLMRPKDPNVDTLNWYYVDQENSQIGPLPKYKMVSLIRNQTIDSNTYVWKTGMPDWVRLKQTELYEELIDHKQTTKSQRVESPSDIDRNMFIKRELGLQMALTIVSCGLYGLVWLYTLAEDSNRIFTVYRIEKVPSGFTVVLLSFLTCGIYAIWFYYSVSKRLAEVPTKGNYIVQDNSIITLLLAFCGLSFISKYLVQSEMNRLIDHV